jgi:hypothetical protein
MQIELTLYYDTNEYNNGMGIGFYPILYPYNKKYKPIYICFELINDIIIGGQIWKQINGPVIYGFIKIRGQELLNILNDMMGVNVNYIYNSARRQVYPITNNTTYYILEKYHSDK